MNPPPYGYCPVCSFPGVTRERSPGGDTTCERNHVYKSAAALAVPQEMHVARLCLHMDLTRQPSLDGESGTVDVLHKNKQVAFSGDEHAVWKWLRTRFAARPHA